MKCRLYSVEILCSVDRIRISTLFMLTLLLLVTNSSFLFLMPLNTLVLFKLSFFVSVQQEKISLYYKLRVTFSGTRALKNRLKQKLKICLSQDKLNGS